jgi:antitoxin component YwqK of YwqJK toxin-antitoxin module
MVGANAPLITLGLLLAVTGAAAAAPDATFIVDGGCRDGVPQGRYELRTMGGTLRVAGAFSHGIRTGSFIFWNAAGSRIAHVPYDEDVRNGTIATWYDGPAGTEPLRRDESAWRRGARDGSTRTWYPDGRRRSEAEFAKGTLVTATAWSDAGARLTEHAARELILRDAAAADARYEQLETLIRAHLPQCD